ncbi:MAG: carbohydrate ABC transporter permease [Anaeroplasmataceae bacterium]|nr:carbohydrate ABC transporter permease [Anaeroplasmataceae bacterium]
MENLSQRESSLQQYIKTDEELRKIEQRQKVFKVLRLVITYFLLFVLAIVIVFPFYWMIISSLKTQDEYYWSKPTFFPQTLDWVNYGEAWASADFGRYMINTILVGVVSTILSVIITILAAFAFSRLKFKGRETVFSILLATMMIPGEMFTVTNYVTVSNLGWKDSYIVLIMPFLVSVFYIYLLRQNFKQIPDSLYYAAKVDGTSDLKYLTKVMIPLSMPTIITITIMKMMGAWNSYVWPRLVANKDAYRLITNGLRQAFSVEAGQRVDYPLQMAAVTVVSIPLFLVFVFFRKYIMRGVARSGTKG